MNDKNFESLAPEKSRAETHNPIRNASGCVDRTAHDAIRNADEQAAYEEMRYKTFLKTIFSICKLSGFYIENHIEVKDLKTGRAWR